jgi:hypothetical protein
MGFLKSFMIKSRSKSSSEPAPRSNFARNVPYHGAPLGIDLTKRLPPKILERIFEFVCPHTQDDTYESCEQSAVEDACMLCDMRDLAHCVRACRRWRKLAANVLYVFSVLDRDLELIVFLGITVSGSIQSIIASEKTSWQRIENEVLSLTEMQNPKTRLSNA